MRPRRGPHPGSWRRGDSPSSDRSGHAKKAGDTHHPAQSRHTSGDQPSHLPDVTRRVQLDAGPWPVSGRGPPRRRPGRCPPAGRAEAAANPSRVVPSVMPLSAPLEHVVTAEAERVIASI